MEMYFISVFLLALYAIGFTLISRRASKRIAKLTEKVRLQANEIDELKSGDLRIFGKVENPQDYSLVQVEVTVMVQNDQVDKVLTALQSNTTIVHHEVLETYNAGDFQIQGGM